MPYDTLVRYFFKHHESTAAYPTQYRSVILYADDEQKATATNVLCEVKVRGTFARALLLQPKMIAVAAKKSGRQDAS